MCKEWFATWFDTKYYHLLYRNRNEVEAHHFIDALLRFLDPKPDAHFLDVACGKGRHAHYLRNKGFITTGLDLSENSIKIASDGIANDPNIQFIQHDIREKFPVSECDYALNLFTSFGYFDTLEEHQTALQHVSNALSDSGVFVMDYLNVDEVLQNLSHEDVQSLDGIEFHIKRYKSEGCIIKSIDVHDRENVTHFEERVRAFHQSELSDMIAAAGFEVQQVFGNYALEDYNSNSPRVIIIAKKCS